MKPITSRDSMCQSHVTEMKSNFKAVTIDQGMSQNSNFIGINEEFYASLSQKAVRGVNHVEPFSCPRSSYGGCEMMKVTSSRTHYLKNLKMQK